MSVADPYVFSTCYAFALMLLCTECWFRSDPWLFNHSPLYLFRAPGEPSKAPAPMTPYTRVFSAWHAGGVCFCFFMSLLGMGFPVQQKKEVSLALGLLWIIWGTTNSWRAIYGKAEFYRPGAAMHSLIGGCGICGFWNLAYWLSHTTALRFAEVVVLTVFTVFAVAAACYGIFFWQRSSQNHNQNHNKDHGENSSPA